jgi:hypothetical protein
LEICTATAILILLLSAALITATVRWLNMHQPQRQSCFQQMTRPAALGGLIWVFACRAGPGSRFMPICLAPVVVPPVRKNTPKKSGGVQ